MFDKIVRRRAEHDPSFPESRIQCCAFTGYRPQKMPFGFDEESALCVDFKARLLDSLEMLIFQGYGRFISGGALGMDMFAAEMILELRKKYPWIVLEMAVPFDDQAAKWKPEYRERYERLLREADQVTWIGHECQQSSMLKRNRYMVSQADLLLAAWDGKPGGTAMTVRMARKMGVQLTCIPPVIDEARRERRKTASRLFSEVGAVLAAG